MMFLILKTVLSLSISGTLLILLFLGGGRFFRNRCSRRWQYYVWLVVVLRLLLPFEPEINLMGKISRTLDREVTGEASVPEEEQFSFAAAGTAASPGPFTQDIQGTAKRPEKTAGERWFPEGVIRVCKNYIGWVWLAVALGMLIRKITAYQSFVRYAAATAAPICDITLLEELSAAAEQAGVRRKVELRVNPQLSSPTLTGIFHPCIVLPYADLAKKEFHCIVLHELIHCRRWDIFYKWLVQLVVCLHWFNPFVYKMSREIANACEFSCDEAVVEKMGYENARDYGKTLLNAMAAVGKGREPSAAVTLSTNKILLKERLVAIMDYRKKSGINRILTAGLTVCLVLGVVFVGVYPAEAAETQISGQGTESEHTSPAKPEEKKVNGESKKASEEINTYYEAGSLPLFEASFGRLEEKVQSAWLERIYEDGEIAFFSAAVRQLSADSPLTARFAGKAYEDDNVAFFSVLADCMGEETLEEWLDKALEEQKFAFQSLLYDRLHSDAEKEEWEKELAKELAEEYSAAGIRMKGKEYYYEGKLVNIFLDLRPDKAFYTLNINPAGTVSIKILRDEEGRITGAAYLTEEEFKELFGEEKFTDLLSEK